MPEKISITTSFASDRLAIAVNYWSETLLTNNKHIIEFRPYGNIVEYIKTFAGGSSINTETINLGVINIIFFRLEDLVYTHPEIMLQNSNNNSGGNVNNEKLLWNRKIDEFIHVLKQCYCNIEKIKTPVTSPLFLYICPSSPYFKHSALVLDMENRIRNELENQYNLIHLLSKKRFSMLNLFPTIFVTSCNNYDNEKNNEISNEDSSYLVNKQNDIWYDLNSDTSLHTPFKPIASLALGQLCARLIKNCQSNFTPRKVIVLDCDNTLWGSSVSEVGVHNIILSKNYLWLQTFFIHLQRMGYLLCLCSKNNEQDVLDVFKTRSDEMILKIDEHVVSYRINWNNKLNNIKQLSNELQLSLDSFIFVDDNSGECEFIRKECAAITVVQIPQNSNDIPLSLLHSWVFDRPLPLGSIATNEDKVRTQRYRESAKRQLAIKEKIKKLDSHDGTKQVLKASMPRLTASYDAIISSLAVKVHFENFVDNKNIINEKIPRIKQLIERTNQFNASGKRAYSTNELLKYMHNCHNKGMCTTNANSSNKEGDNENFIALVSVTDRFGHYGDVGVMLYSVIKESPIGSISDRCSIGNILFVETFLLSCRALQRSVEYKMLQFLGEQARNKHGCKYIHIPFVKLPRNDPIKRFLESISNVNFIKETSVYEIDSEIAIDCTEKNKYYEYATNHQLVGKNDKSGASTKNGKNIVAENKISKHNENPSFMNNLHMLKLSRFSSMQSLVKSVYDDNLNCNKRLATSPLKGLMKTLENAGSNPRIRGNIRNEVKDIFGKKKFLGDKKRKAQGIFSTTGDEKKISNIKLNKKQKQERAERAKLWKIKNGVM